MSTTTYRDSEKYLLDNSYEYNFIMKINSDNNLVPELFYTFNAPFKINGALKDQIYHVHIELHPQNFYGIKFHLKEHKKNKYRYNIRVNRYLARRIIFTCIRIAYDLSKNEPLCSFGFIGSNTLFSMDKTSSGIQYTQINENKSNTKRYRIYSRLINTFFSLKHFEHRYNEQESSYVLIRKSELEKDPELLHKIEKYFSSTYNNFA